MVTHPDCTCGQCPLLDTPAKDWVVTRLTDRGPGEYYRYRTEGVNLNHPPCSAYRKFSWSVPELDERYDLSAAAIFV